MLGWIIDQLRREWRGLRRSPILGLLIFSAGFIAAFIISSWHYSEEISDLTERIQLKDERMAGVILPAEKSAYKLISNEELCDQEHLYVTELQSLKNEVAKDEKVEGKNPLWGQTDEVRRFYRIEDDKYKRRYKIKIMLLRDAMIARLTPKDALTATDNCCATNGVLAWSKRLSSG